jgi:hypothetical protein
MLPSALIMKTWPEVWPTSLCLNPRSIAQSRHKPSQHNGPAEWLMHPPDWTNRSWESPPLWSILDIRLWGEGGYYESRFHSWSNELIFCFRMAVLKKKDTNIRNVTDIRVIICPSTQLCVVSSVHLYYSYIFIHYMFRLSGSHLQMW